MNEAETLYSRRTIPPYGPVKGMLAGLDLLRRTSPGLVDEEFLKANQVAPHNEYKVVGALKFLGLLDEDGRPTEKSRLLKTRGAAFALNLQTIIRDAYADLFAKLNLREAGPDDIHNYFITQAGLGPEMANKATRFFIELCKMAEIAISATGRRSAPSSRPGGATGGRSGAARPSEEAAVAPVVTGMAGFPVGVTIVSGPAFPILLAVTPELAQMDEEELVKLLQKLQRAARRALLAGD